MRLLLARCLRSAVNALVAFGHLWVYVPPLPRSPAAQTPQSPPAPPGPHELTGPAPGHPERLCPEVPLTETEMALRRQLLGASGAELSGD
ncbi:DUF6059 family protein [Streptomyces liangshanensis]|uniref:Uncharacterized protein n=1 Tax=Streptomyces liangshanensis TaxID=2717324 RepID=A0A6G9GSD2_9ACTN|nr:DUF6059 family protein [Streptomyces liangshanensis]QIQ01168.1 hypothetical protein HA039_01610 [Streptomyces liangshanensis]